MRTQLAALLIAATLPAAAQTLPDLDHRVTRLERQVDRVSRRVLPKAEQTMIEPEVSTAVVAPAAPPAPPATAASVSDLADRMSAVERRQREITNTLEEQGNRLRLVEERLTKLDADSAAKPARPEGAGSATAPLPPGPALAPGDAPVPKGASVPAPPAAAAPAAAPTTPDGRFKAALALYQAKDWPGAQAAWQAFVDKAPRERLSAGRYWLGRSYYNDGRFDDSARTHFANYKADPKGDHAQESLFWVGQSLFRLKRLKEACQVYDLAGKVYDTSLKPEMVGQFAAARVKAACR